jgi:hypothetical protein
MADKHTPPRGSDRAAPETRPVPERDEAADDSPLDSLGKAIVDPVLSSQPTTPADIVHDQRHPDEKKR